MDSVWLQVISYAVVAVAAAFITYVFAVRTTRKGKLFDAKLTAYGDVLGHFQEVLIGIDNLAELQDYDAADTDSFLPNLMNLTSDLTGLGDIETLTVIGDQKKFAELLEKKGPQIFIQDLQSRAVILNSHNVARNLAEARFLAGRLKLVKPTDKVKDAVENIQASVRSGSLGVLMKTFDKSPDLIDIEIPEDLQAMAKSREDWRKEVESAVEGLVTAMQEDLDKTL